MPRKIRAGDRWIGDGEPCFVIAEAGSNHDASLELAFRLIEIAAASGADAVKFQLFRSAKLYTKNAGMSDYLKVAKPINEIIESMEMPYDWLPRLVARCKESNILFLASVFDEESADQIEPYVEAFKIASYELTHIPLLRHVARKGKPVILSTGTADIHEVREAVEEICKTGNQNLALMQCTAAYPAPIDSLNVRAISAMKGEFGCPVGLSDHSRDPLVGPMAAVAVGANLLEKHFTLSNRLPGPDHMFAVEPNELEAMVSMMRKIESALGDGSKAPHGVELELRRFARRSIFALRDIPAGEEFTLGNVAVLRCGKAEPNLAPRYIDEILGRKARRALVGGDCIRKEDYA